MKRALLFLCIAFAFGCALPSERQLPESYVSLFEQDLNRLVTEGLHAAKKGRYSDAEFAFRKALVASPQNDRLLLNLATALARQQIFAEAEEIYNSMLRRNPVDLRAKSGLAHLYTDQQRYAEARAVYQEILDETEGATGELVNIRANAYRSLAALSFRLGFEEEATCYSEFSVATTPGNTAQVARHSRLLLSRGLLDKLAETLESVNPDTAPDFLSHQLVLFLYEVGRDNDARLVCEGLVVRPAIAPAVEADCLWILAFTKDFTVINTDVAELEDEVRVRGFELAAREFGNSGGSLFVPLRLTESISATQKQLLRELEVPGLEDEEPTIEELSLFAFPTRLKSSLEASS